MATSTMRSRVSGCGRCRSRPGSAIVAPVLSLAVQCARPPRLAWPRQACVCSYGVRGRERGRWTSRPPHMSASKEQKMDLGDSFQNFTDTIFDFLPRLIGFLLILLVGFIIAKVVSAVVAKALEKVGVDRRLQESDASKYVDAVLPGSSPSRGI